SDRVRFVGLGDDVPGAKRFSGIVRQQRLGGENLGWLSASRDSLYQTGRKATTPDRSDYVVELQSEREQLVGEAGVSFNYQRIIIGARDISVGKLLRQLA